MRLPQLTVFSEVESKMSPDILTKRVSANLTFDLTFFSQGEEMSNTIREIQPLKV